VGQPSSEVFKEEEDCACVPRVRMIRVRAVCVCVRVYVCVCAVWHSSLTDVSGASDRHPWSVGTTLFILNDPVQLPG
jgi:hypothetical protein